MSQGSFTIPESIEAAREIQEKARSRVILDNTLENVRLVAGVDVGFEENDRITKAAIAVFHFPSLELVETAIARIPTCFPYIPGFLSFREIPAILPALERLHSVPDLYLCDGQGIAHPRRLGIASHLGVVIDRPTIGVAKSLLLGKHATLGEEKGSYTPLIAKNETIGMVFRSRTRVKPLYLSIGHRVDLATAIEYVSRCLTKYRLPEPTRIADKLSKTGSGFE
jgi:deoxyribonuclease V